MRLIMMPSPAILSATPKKRRRPPTVCCCFSADSSFAQRQSLIKSTWTKLQRGVGPSYPWVSIFQAPEISAACEGTLIQHKGQANEKCDGPSHYFLSPASSTPSIRGFHRRLPYLGKSGSSARAYPADNTAAGCLGAAITQSVAFSLLSISGPACAISVARTYRQCAAGIRKPQNNSATIAAVLKCNLLCIIARTVVVGISDCPAAG